MICTYCLSWRVYWKNLGTLHAYTYCPDCRSTDCAREQHQEHEPAPPAEEK